MSDPTNDPTVTRRFDRLLWAYPRGSRREEVLDTLLLMAAESGRTRPTPRQRANALRHGLRARLGRPASRFIVPLALLVSLIGGFYTAALAHRLAWEVNTPALPTAAQFTQIQQAITPGVTAARTESHRGVLAEKEDGVTHGARVGYVGYHAHSTPETRDLAAYHTSTLERLAANGWRVTHSYLDDTRLWVTADRGDWALMFGTEADSVFLDPAAATPVELTVERLTPWWVRAAALAGILPGLILGWLLTGWVSRRTAASPAAATRTAVLAGVTVFLFGPGVVIAAIVLPYEIATGGGPFWAAMVPGYDMGAPLVLAATVTTAAVLLDAALAPHWARRRPPAQPEGALPD